MTNSIGMTLIYVEAGEFFMGSIDTPEALSKTYGARIYAYEGEDPLHFVELTEGFWMGQTEVTRGQYRQFVAKTGYRTLAERDRLGAGIDELGWRWIRIQFSIIYPRIIDLSLLVNFLFIIDIMI